MKKIFESRNNKIMASIGIVCICIITIFASQLLGSSKKDTFEMQVKYLGGNPDVLKLEMPHTGSGVELTVLKNGEVFKKFDSNDSSGRMDLADLKVEEYDYSRVSYLLTQEQYESDHDFKKGTFPNWEEISKWHINNMGETKPFEKKAQFLSEDGKVLAETVIQYIVVDEEVALIHTLEAGSQITVKNGEENLEGVFQDHMKKVQNTNGLEYTDSYTGDVDVNVPGSYPIIVSRTTKRNGLINRANFTIIVEEKEVVVADKPNNNPTKPNTNNSSPNNATNNKPNTGGSVNSGSKPTTPSKPNTNGGGSNNTGNSGNGGNNSGGSTAPIKPSRPSPSEATPEGMTFYKDYGNTDACIQAGDTELDKHYREWQSSYCDDNGYMFYTPYN